MKTITGSFGVDAGNISVVDMGYLKRNGGQIGDTAKRCCKVVDIENGKYKVRVDIPSSWDGHVTASKMLEVTSGQIAIGDMCYFFSIGEVEHAVWIKFLDKTKYLKSKSKKYLSISTGGDGELRAIVTLTKL